MQGISIQICNAHQLHDENSDEQVENISEDSAAVKTVQLINAALIDCDLLIVLDEILRSSLLSVIKKIKSHFIQHQNIHGLQGRRRINERLADS